MRLYLIRHCESENNALWARTGAGDGRSADPLLTPLGEKQALILAGFLAANLEPSSASHTGGPLRDGFGITHLYTSLMQRAIQTGEPIARAIHLPLVAWPEIHERGGIYLDHPQTGEPQGLSGPGRPFFVENYPILQLPDSLGSQGWWGRPYEEKDAAFERALRVLQMLKERHGGTEDRVAFITHGGFTQSLFQALFGFSSNGSMLFDDYLIWIKMNNASITRIDMIDDLIRLSYLNYVDYMPGEYLT